jgi:peptidoglycan/xylan/chitin deacetylase (PgdA/CDA1 family)
MFNIDRIFLYSLLPGVRRRSKAGTDSPALYLTFDDGPDPDVTPRILDVLEEWRAHATFFVIGEKAQRHPALVKQIAARGHALGNHSFSHRRFGELLTVEQLSEIWRTDALLAAVDGKRSHPFRPPHGRAPIALLLNLVSRGHRTVLWSIDSTDYGHDAVKSIARLSESHVKDGDIVLMHDDHRTALEVLAAVLPKWSAAGLSHPVLDAD